MKRVSRTSVGATGSNEMGESKRSPWLVAGVVGLLLMSGLVLFVSQRTRSRNEAEYRETLAKRLISGAKYSFSGEKGLIGQFAPGKQWKRLPLGVEQRRRIEELSSAFVSAKGRSIDEDIRHYETVPKGMLEYQRVASERRRLAMHHGLRMLPLGMLSKGQMNFALTQRFAGPRPYHALANSVVQELLDLDEAQKTEVKNAHNECLVRLKALSLMSTDAYDIESNNAKRVAYKDARDQRSLAVLSDLQQQPWQELTSHHEPPPPLDFIPSETKSFEQLTDYSPVFKALVSKNDLEITEEQQEVLRSLAVSVSAGISWIESGPGDRAPFLDGDPRNGDTPRKKTLTEFIWHTERFVLFGVLTRTQAEKIDPDIHDILFDSEVSI